MSNNTKFALLCVALCWFFVLFADPLARGCVDHTSSAEALESSGYSDIRFDGYGWLRCDKNDLYSTKFTAKNPTGREVSGVVCCGRWWKACTVRF